MESSPLDAIDRAILYPHQEDGQRPISEIADAVNVSDNTIRNRIQAMKEQGIISGYQVNVDYDAAGIQHHYMFVCTARVSQREQYADAIREFPIVVEVVTLMTGTNNVLIEAVANDKDNLSALAYKIDDLGLVIERENLIREHSRQPFSGFSLDETPRPN